MATVVLKATADEECAWCGFPFDEGAPIHWAASVSEPFCGAACVLLFHEAQTSRAARETEDARG